MQFFIHEWKINFNQLIINGWIFYSACLSPKSADFNIRQMYIQGSFFFTLCFFIRPLIVSLWRYQLPRSIDRTSTRYFRGNLIHCLCMLMVMRPHTLRKSRFIKRSICGNWYNFSFQATHGIKCRRFTRWVTLRMFSHRISSITFFF